MLLSLLPLVVELATLLLTLAGLVYLILALLAVRSFAREAAPATPALLPTVSILKPVKGLDPGLQEALRSHCRQSYAGRYELLLGATGGDTAGLQAMADEVREEFPAASLRVLPCPAVLGSNGCSRSL